MKIYESTALLAGATDAPVAVNPLDHDATCLQCKAEITRRGGAVVPLLTDALKREVTLHRPATPRNFAPGLFTDEILLLRQIGDPQAVVPLLDIADMPRDPADSFRGPRYQALSVVENLTYVSFRKVRPQFDNCFDAVQHPSALDCESFADADVPKAVQLYRDWLAGDGKDPAQWLALARKRARVLLDSDDLDDVYCGVSFLVFPVNRGASPELRDDLPERTVQRLGQILGGAKPVPGSDKHDFRSRGQPFPMSLYQYRGQTLPISPYNWLSYLAAYGPRVDPSPRSSFACRTKQA